MKKGINKKILIVVLSALLLLMPFSISADENNNPGQLSAYNYFIKHGLSYEMTQNINGYFDLDDSHLIFDANEFALLMSNSESYNVNVYQVGNNGYLGTYLGFDLVMSGEAGYYKIVYIKSNGQVSNCNNCYIKIDQVSVTNSLTVNNTIWNPNQIDLTISNGDINSNLSIKESEPFKFLKGKYTSVGQYQSNDYLFVDRTSVIMFAVPKEVYNGSQSAFNNGIAIQKASTNNATITTSTTRFAIGQYCFYIVEVNTTETGWCNIDFTTLNNLNLSKLIPLYYGFKDNMSSDLYAFAYGNIDLSIDASLKSVDNKMTTNNSLLTQLRNLFENGNNASQSSVNELDDVNDELGSQSNDFINQQNSFNDSMNSNLENIDTNFNLMENQGFVSTAAWVRNRFNELTSSSLISGNNALGLMINFALIIGLALTILGKLRS